MLLGGVRDWVVDSEDRDRGKAKADDSSAEAGEGWWSWAD